MNNRSHILFTTLICAVICILPSKLFSQDVKEFPGLKKITSSVKNYAPDTRTLLTHTFTIKEFNKKAQLTYHLEIVNGDTAYIEKNTYKDNGKILNEFTRKIDRDFFYGFGTGTLAKYERYNVAAYEYDAKDNEVRCVINGKVFANDTLWHKNSGETVLYTKYKYADNDSILNKVSSSSDSESKYYEWNSYGQFGKIASKVCTYGSTDTILYKWEYDKTGNKINLNTVNFKDTIYERKAENYFYNTNKSLTSIEKTSTYYPGERKIIYLTNNKTDSIVQYKNSERSVTKEETFAKNDTLPSLSFYNDFREEYYPRKLIVDNQKRLTMAFINFDGILRLSFFEYKDNSIYPSKIEKYGKTPAEMKKYRKFPEWVMEYQYEFH